MATNWTLSAQQICTAALEHVGAVAGGETPSAEDMQKALCALNAVLKELPLHGYNWPKLSGEVALTWDAGSPATIAAPADYYGYPCAWKTVDGVKVPLTPLTHAEWAKLDKTTEGEPTHFYVTPAKAIAFYPIPESDPGAYLQYQKLVDDAVATSAPDLDSYWHNPLGWGVANEIGMDFGAAQQDRLEISQRWQAKREMCLQSSIPSAPISFSVDG